MNRMHGIIFSFEKPTGLGKLTEPRIHGSVPFGGEYRMVDFMLSNMVNAGIRDVGVVMHGKCQSMLDHLRSGKSWDLSRNYGGLTLLPSFAYTERWGGDGRYRGKLEALAYVMDYVRHIRQEYVVLADCDLAVNLELEPVLQAHLASGADITAVCTPQPGGSDETYFQLDDTGRIIRTTCNDFAPSGYRSLNIYVLRRDLLVQLVEWCVSRNEYSLRRGVLQNMAATLHLQAYVFDGFCAHISDITSYYKSSMALLQPGIRHQLFRPDHPIYAKENDAPSTYIDPSGLCDNSLISDGCDIQGSVKNCILSRGVRVEKGASVEGCILFKDTVVRRGANVRYVIADKNVDIGANVQLIGGENYPLVLGKFTKV